jgi:hypothetical protein
MAYGSRPVGDEQLISGRFVNGLSWGDNIVFKNGIGATGNSQATAFQMPTQVAIYQIDASTASTAIGVNMPPAIQGNNLFVINNTANAVTVYPPVANNAATGAQDTFNNNAASFSLPANSGVGFTCGKNGRWFTN